MRRHLLGAALCAVTGTSLLAALPLQGVPADGYQLEELAVPPPTLPGGPFGATVFGVARTLSNGDVVTFDGQTVLRVTADGTPIATLGTLPSIVFPGCFAIDPTETFALIGESTTHDVYRAALDGSGMTFLLNLPNNFQAVFEAPGVALVSANLSLSFTDNDIVRLDTTTGAITPVCHVAGPSGPLVLDADGNLFYGQQSSNPASGRILLWLAAELASGVPLDESDAIVGAGGFQGIATLAIDGVNGGLYAGVGSTTPGVNRVVRVFQSAALSTVLVEGPSFHYLSDLEFLSDPCGALFQGWQPQCGGTLRYSSVNFVDQAHRAELTPSRPQGALTGAGAGPGPGPIAFEVAGGPPAGFAQVFFGPSATVVSPELAHVFPGALPLFTGLSLGSVALAGGVVPLDAAGAAQLLSYDPGLDGVITVQAICFDGTGLAVGTSTAADL